MREPSHPFILSPHLFSPPHHFPNQKGREKKPVKSPVASTLLFLLPGSSYMELTHCFSPPCYLNHSVSSLKSSLKIFPFQKPLLQSHCPESEIGVLCLSVCVSPSVCLSVCLSRSVCLSLSLSVWGWWCRCGGIWIFVVKIYVLYIYMFKTICNL